MAETPIPVAVMREAYKAAIIGQPKNGRSRDDMIDLGMRAAVRALAAQFRDPVIINALLWAAAEGEAKP